MKVATDKPGQQQGVLEVVARLHAMNAPPASETTAIPFSLDIKEIVREPTAGRNVLTQQQINDLLTPHKAQVLRPKPMMPQTLRVA